MNPSGRTCRFLLVVLCTGSLAVAVAGQTRPAPAATALPDLLAEAVRNNPALRAVRLQAQATRASIPAAQAMPDASVSVQQFAVGSPKPFAGFSNSGFAYIGLGVEQQLPWPGKRRLRAEVVRRGVDVERENVAGAERQLLETIRVDYFQLAAAQQIITVVERNRDTLTAIEQAAEGRYRVGQASQQDVLKAQIERTRILAQLADERSRMGELEAQLKEVLHRPQSSPDIVAAAVVDRPLTIALPSLLGHSDAGNPQVGERRARAAQAQAQIDLARKNFKPDFGVQYMWQHTASQFRDYYMATLSMNLPNRGRRRAELAQATLNHQEAQAEVEAATDASRAAIARQYVLAQTAEQQLHILDQGLVPQAQAVFRSALSSYQSARVDFETLMNAFLDLQKLQIERQQQLADHESALARLQALTGVSLP